jgi:hypothetical protein
MAANHPTTAKEIRTWVTGVLLKMIELYRLVSSEEEWHPVDLQVLDRLCGKGIEPAGEFLMLTSRRRHSHSTGVP